MNTRVLPNGMVALVRKNGAVRYRDMEAALLAQKKYRESGIQTKIFTFEQTMDVVLVPA